MGFSFMTLRILVATQVSLRNGHLQSPPLHPWCEPMGDKSPKANQKKSSQKNSKSSSADNKKNQAIAAKQAAGQASKKKK
jgi:hypothetical protein